LPDIDVDMLVLLGPPAAVSIAGQTGAGSPIRIQPSSRSLW